MSKHLSQNDLEKLYRKEVRKKKENERLTGSELQEIPKGNKKLIFLSHCHEDKTIVTKIHLLFRRLNIKLYIDWMDHSLPASTDNITASTIKNKIDTCNKFIFLATYRALSSKWCNWELGLAYSSKGEKDFAILPIESKSGKWPGNEFLQLYPEMRIDTGDLERVEIEDIKISLTNQQEMSFEEWLLL